MELATRRAQCAGAVLAGCDALQLAACAAGLWEAALGVGASLGGASAEAQEEAIALLSCLTSRCAEVEAEGEAEGEAERGG